jgi:uncharacterized protein (TIGR02147 family)
LLSQVLNSKKLASRRLLDALSDALDLDVLARSELSDAYLSDVLSSKGLRQPLQRSVGKDFVQSSDPVKEIIADDQTLLKSWLHMAVLESTGCSNFSEAQGALARRFSVKEDKVAGVLRELLQSGYLQRDADGRLGKTDKKMRIPTNRTRAVVREFHAQMLQKGLAHLGTRTSAEDFQARLMTGYTVAVNLKNLDQAKLILQKALQEIAELLSTGDCERVYQLQAQLFPLD